MFQVLPMARPSGKIVLPEHMTPWVPSSVCSSGIPSRVFSMAIFCSSLKYSACCAGALREDVVGQREEAAARARCRRCQVPGEPAARLAVWRRVRAEIVHVHARHVHLPDLFLQGHAAEQIFDPPLHRLLGVAIERLVGRRLRGTSGVEERCQAEGHRGRGRES